MKKLISAVLLSVFTLSFVAGIAVSKAQAVDICMIVDCKYSPLYGDYYLWCCENVIQKGKNGKIVYSNCHFLYDREPCLP